MSSAHDHQGVYEELAEECDRRRDSSHRDIFLVLAAECALSGGQAVEAERLRLRLLEANPQHRLRPFAGFAEAMNSDDVREFVQDLQQQFPPAWSENLLARWRRESGQPGDEPKASIFDSVFSEPAASDDPFAPPAVADAAFFLPPEPEEPPPAPKPPVELPVAEAPRPKRYELHDKSATPGGKPKPSKKARRAQAPARRSIVGAGIIYLLVGLVALAGLALLGYVLARPFIKL